MKRADLFCRAVLFSALAMPGWPAVAAPVGQWSFRVELDGKPIGDHRFTSRADGQARIEANFDVKVLGFTAYRYRFESTEQWRGDCLASMTANTDDDGKASEVRLAGEGDALTLSSPQGRHPVSGCLMTFAYWNPAMLDQKRLLNPQTGVIEKVEIQRLADEPVDVRGQQMPARHYRITGPEQPIELWYSPQGEWLGLASQVKGRQLRYRLQ